MVTLSSEPTSHMEQRVDVSLFEKFVNEEVVSVVELFVFKKQMQIEGRHKEPVGYINNVYTKPEFRGKGYAEELVRKAIDYCREIGCYKVFLVCGWPTATWYEKMGLNNVGLHMQVMLK